jgi:hypothetical protein
MTADAYSSFHYSMGKFKSFMGSDKYWKRLVYYSATTIGDMVLFFLPEIGYIWMHESFHRAVFTQSGVRSHIGYDFPNGAYAVPDSWDFSYWHNIPRAAAAGIESEYLLVEKLQRNNFFYSQNMENEFFYWLANIQAWSYAYTPISSGNITMTVDGKEQEAATDSLLWAYALFHPGEYFSDDYDELPISFSSLQDNEKEFLKTRVMLGLLNVVSPMMFGVRSIPLGAGFSGNFALRHFYTSFGTDSSADIYLKRAPYNFKFVFHNYINYEHYFPAVEAELVDFPVRLGGLNMLLSPRILIGAQPRDQNFFTADPEFFGLAGLRVDFALSKHFLPYIEFTAKPDGWATGNEFLEHNLSLKAGISARF